VYLRVYALLPIIPPYFVPPRFSHIWTPCPGLFENLPKELDSSKNILDLVTYLSA
jgi:hypothetical protein